MSKRARSAECPLCGAPASIEHRPFCGQGCRDRDLLNWLGEAYRVPGPLTHVNDGADPENRLDSE